MKKTFISFVALLVFVPAAAFAATASLSPAALTAESGQVISVSVYIHPQSAKVYTAKVSMQFPAGSMDVVSFSQGPGWIPLGQPGYDVTDNARGVVIKTAGYSGGASTDVLFGTLNVRVKSAGSVSVDAASQILDANNQNVFSGGLGTAISLRASAPAPVTPTPNPTRGLFTAPATVKAPVSTKSIPSVSALPVPTSTPTSTPALTATSSAKTAAVYDAPASRGLSPLMLGLIGCLLSFGVGIFVGNLQKS